MPLHPQTEALVAGLAGGDENRPATHELSPDAARQGYLGLARAFGPVPDVAAVEDRTLTTTVGDVPVRVYTPTGEAPFPVLVYYHGGGWVIGDLDTHDRECRTLCNEADCIVVAVDYRLAPEHPFPASHDDCWAATKWVYENAAHLNGDPGRLAVAGDSAGGNLAAFVAIMARDNDIPLRLQALIYPATDARGHNPDFDGERHQSLLDNKDAPFLTLDTMNYFFNHLTTDRDPVAVANDWRLSPMLAASHQDLAPAFIATCEYDPIRDEGNAYAELLASSGVPVQHRQWAGQPHLLFQLSPVLDDGKALLAETAAALRTALQ
jgi:acetyl esterase